MPVSKKKTVFAKRIKRRPKAFEKEKPMEPEETETVSETVPEPSSIEKPCDEELALKMLELYFSEVARFGLKRSLSLDEVINAYFYSLARIQRSSVELKEIEQIAKKSNF